MFNISTIHMFSSMHIRNLLKLDVVEQTKTVKMHVRHYSAKCMKNGKVDFLWFLRKMLNIFFIVPVNPDKLWQTSRERDACKQSWSIRDKLMNLSKVGLSMESSIAEFFIFSSAFVKLFYLWRRWCNGLCLQVPCRSCYSCPLAHKRFDNCRFLCFFERLLDKLLL